jgi:peptidoglycan hydrolase-like protein with peptidoglycan-binding domain
MPILLAMLIASMLWLCPPVIEAQTPGAARPEQGQIISKDNLKLVQQRLQAEGVYAGPLDGELNAETEAALRQYQQKQKIPVSGALDAETLKELQIRLPAGSSGSGN